MRIVCVGGGPAGLYASILLKLRDREHDVTVFERDPAGTTHGWGVVYWDDLLVQLVANDPATARSIRESSVTWPDQVLDIDGRKTVHSGRGGYSIGRHRLLAILAARVTELGVRVVFDHPVDDLGECSEADLVIASEGVGSAIRQQRSDEFGTQVAVGRNKYIWLGTTRVFDGFTFAMTESSGGWIWFHGYAFDENTSTCVVECPPETWSGLGFDELGDAEAITALEKIFAGPLDGHALMNRDSAWLNFRTITNAVWHSDDLVLVGDAAHSTHFSIGSGTKLALEDAICLVARLHDSAGLRSALENYETERKAALLQPQSEARFSAAFFEDLARYRGLPDRQFFTLLRERRSPLLARIPPRLYYQLHHSTQRFKFLRKLREAVGPGARALYSRIFH